MFKTFRLATCASLLSLSPVLTAQASAAELKVVASFSIIADFAKNVGGDRVEITTLVGPDGDAHVYEPRPADAVAVSKADVVLVNGLEFEGFLKRLIETSGTKAPIVELTKGVEPLRLSDEPAGHAHPEAEEEEAHNHKAEEAGHKHETADAHDHDHGHEGHHHHGEYDPHAWQSIKNAQIYVKNIAGAFCKADKPGCATYTANSDAYVAKLATLNEKVKTEIAAIPPEKRVIITSHDAFGYFEHAYGLNFLAPEGISTESEASAADVAKLVDQVKHDKASAIFVENITDKRLIDQIASETGLKVGGTLYSDALSTADGPAATYIDMVNHNIETISAAVLGQ
ncbi:MULTISPECIES: zinc ABC transporter substrate-binding protein AztC [Agrobacterium]|uniref:zinc ABC transporter substrate-binding protein AztC n=1 Tax=Agrobacterium TaxID=357 RepID=UPI00027D5741|nr:MULTISPECIES: zinc ABC transporter substrate-binding protein AztC [Agrobacterium]ANV27332.1 metal ABC transporter substrate-binding protein [Rhizobium sp. S41]KGE80685.1 metal ABC transporter substrate-binding protein [Rhizobium sp. H41]MDP9773013.1 zinc/manganese transport system substrate-binding protein [Rhizobium sp. SORGH_AS_0755]OAI85429.1 metal ABC transporter substrate-binding protein [Rhizobium sp. GHKF11]TGR72458.1 metal ABC transporter substrate-binding protein [bacterium M00.F.C